MNVLIADDEPQMLKVLLAYFEKEGFQVYTAKDGVAALTIFESVKIDLAILDWMMPHIDGMEVCKHIKENSSAKVLILTAKGQSDDEVEALNIGADEYVKKPFDPRILIIRAKKLVGFGESLSICGIRLNLDSKKAYKDDVDLKLTKVEYDLLYTFIKNKGMILSRDRLLDLVWGLSYEGDPRTVDTHVRRLRSKIGEDTIKTYRGMGYCMEVNNH